MNNSQVGQAFARGETRGTGSNMFIDGDTVYSYGYHFKIAKRLGGDRVLFNYYTYSNTTAKHKSRVLQSLDGFEVIEAPNCDIDLASEHIQGKIREARSKFTKARTDGMRSHWLKETVRYQQMARVLEAVVSSK